MLPDKLVRDLHLMVLDRPEGGDLAIVRSADVSIPGNLETGELVFRIQDLRTGDLVLWTVDKHLVAAALDESGADPSVSDLRRLLSRLYVDHVGDFDLLETRPSESGPWIVGDNSSVHGDPNIRSGGDIDGQVGQSGGPGDPDLDF